MVEVSRALRSALSGFHVFQSIFLWSGEPNCVPTSNAPLCSRVQDLWRDLLAKVSNEMCAINVMMQHVEDVLFAYFDEKWVEFCGIIFNGEKSAETLENKSCGIFSDESVFNKFIGTVRVVWPFGSGLCGTHVADGFRTPLPTCVAPLGRKGQASYQCRIRARITSKILGDVACGEDRFTSVDYADAVARAEGHIDRLAVIDFKAARKSWAEFWVRVLDCPDEETRVLGVSLCCFLCVGGDVNRFLALFRYASKPYLDVTLMLLVRMLIGVGLLRCKPPVLCTCSNINDLR